jgi:hypothetical protein
MICFNQKTELDYDRKPTLNKKKRSRSRLTAKSQSRWALMCNISYAACNLENYMFNSLQKLLLTQKVLKN